MIWAALIPIIPLVIDALDGWLSAGKITQEEYDKAKALYTEMRARSQSAVDEFNAWLEEPDAPADPE